jgi:hypothetical protein
MVEASPTAVPSASPATYGWRDDLEEVSMLLALGIILLLAWIGGFGIFHVASGFIHILVVLAVISIVLHFVRGKRGS